MAAFINPKDRDIFAKQDTATTNWLKEVATKTNNQQLLDAVKKEEQKQNMLGSSPPAKTVTQTANTTQNTGNSLVISSNTGTNTSLFDTRVESLEKEKAAQKRNNTQMEKWNDPMGLASLSSDPFKQFLDEKAGQSELQKTIDRYNPVKQQWRIDSEAKPLNITGKSEKKAAKIIYQNAKNIIDASFDYGVDPQIVAGVIYAEQANNVNLRDTLTDWVGAYSLLDTSVGVGQVKMSTARTLEEAGYVPKTEAKEVAWQIPFMEGKNGSADMFLEKKLQDDKTNIVYVAAYIKYLQDLWRQKFPAIGDRPDILGSVYNLGHEKVAPHSKPKPNPFGDYVLENYDTMGYLLGID